MTNPDRDELVKLADQIEAATKKVAQWPEKRCGGLPEGELGRVFMDFLIVRNLAENAATALRRLASSDSGVKVRELEWRGPVDAFPTTIWEAKTPFGHYVIEEVSASDSPAYEVRFAGGHVISVKDGLNDAKAAAQADYEARIKSALAEVPAVKGEPLAWADKYGETHPITAESKKTLSNNPTTEPYWSRFSIPLYAAPPADAGMREEVGWLIEMSDPPVYHRVTDDHDVYWTTDASKALRFARRDDAQAYSDHIGWTSPPVRIVEHMWPALTAPGATTKSDGGVEELRDFIYVRQPCHSMDLARALLDQFEIRRK